MLKPSTYSNKENLKHEIYLLLILVTVDNMFDGKSKERKNQYIFCWENEPIFGGLKLRLTEVRQTKVM